MIGRRALAAAAAAGLLAVCAAQAQVPQRVPRIAYLSASPAGDPRSQAFREGLRDFGYTEGRDIIVEEFRAPANADLSAWAARAVARKPAITAGAGTAPAVAAKALTSTIPIVFANMGNPVEIGVVSSLARPGGNVTGTANFQAETAAKRLQILSQLVPGLARVAVLHSTAEP